MLNILFSRAVQAGSERTGQIAASDAEMGGGMPLLGYDRMKVSKLLVNHDKLSVSNLRFTWNWDRCCRWFRS